MNIQFDVKVESGGLIIDQSFETHPGIKVLVSTLYVPDGLVKAFAADVAYAAREMAEGAVSEE